MARQLNVLPPWARSARITSVLPTAQARCRLRVRQRHSDRGQASNGSDVSQEPRAKVAGCSVGVGAALVAQPERQELQPNQPTATCNPPELVTRILSRASEDGRRNAGASEHLVCR